MYRRLPMKIQFDNNSVSGVNRRYRHFNLDLPGYSSQVIDVPPQYVADALSYLKQRHPAVICMVIEDQGASIDAKDVSAVEEETGQGNNQDDEPLAADKEPVRQDEDGGAIADAVIEEEDKAVAPAKAKKASATKKSAHKEKAKSGGRT
jgi:hypothetical protein